MGSLFLIVLGLILLQIFSIYGACPNPFSILPCTCSDENGSRPIITCNSITSGDELKSVMIAAKKQKIFEVRIQSASFNFFIEGTFNEIEIQSLEIADSSIFSLVEEDFLNLGFENSLKSLKVNNCSFVNSWKWKHIQKLKQLRSLEIGSSGLLELSEHFLNVSDLTLEDISFKDNFIDYVPYRAFANFSDLVKLNLDRNELTSVIRSMFPYPAKKLQSLGLSYNKIRGLPVNAFTEMPGLKFLYLGGNPILVLEEQTFKSVWHQLSMVLLQDTPLFCTCQISWIANAKRAKTAFIAGKCESPPHLKGKKITELKSEDFRC